jgi:hypothetical protein
MGSKGRNDCESYMDDGTKTCLLDERKYTTWHILSAGKELAAFGADTDVRISG